MIITNTLIVCVCVAYVVGVLAGAYVVWQFWLVPEQIDHENTRRLHLWWRSVASGLSARTKTK